MSRTIRPPPGMAPVADVVDPVHGPDEIPPCPGLDGPGSMYLVGVEREVWTSVSVGGDHVRGWGWLGPDGRLLVGRPAVQELQRRGARLMRLVPSWGPVQERADEASPLRPVPPQLELFGRAA